MNLAAGATGNVISTIQITNIQSWGDQSRAIELLPVGFNILLARSETGKSILFKIFSVVCFPNMHGRNSRKALIRYRKSCGIAEIGLSNGSIVTFELYQTKTVYRLKRQGETERIWEGQTIPDEIAVEMGWVIDTKNQILLNLIDDDHSKLFIATSPGYNAQILATVSENKEVKRRYAVLKEWIGIVSKRIKELSPTRDYLANWIQHNPIMDAETLTDKLTQLRAYDDAYCMVLQLISDVTYVDAYNTQIARSQILDVKKVQKYFAVLEALDSIFAALTAYKREADKLTQLRKQTQIDIARCDKLVAVYDAVTQCESNAIAIPELNRKVASAKTGVDLSRFEKLATVADLAVQLTADTQEYIRHVVAYGNALKTHKNALAQKAAMEKEQGVCPVCGGGLVRDNS